MHWKHTPTDLDYSFLSQLSDPETGNNMYLLNPIVLRLRQDQVLLAYPFNYLTAVNGKSTEVVVNYENKQNFSGCDDTSKINPTCGVKHERGQAIQYSQGFCCFCPEEPAPEKQIRGGQDCSFDKEAPGKVDKQKYKASAHCLEFSDVWYSVSALSEPSIIHETFIQVYNLKHLKNGSSVWVALTHDEDFELGTKNPFQYDENKTIIISYLTSRPQETSATIPVAERRLLIPQPMPAKDIKNLPDAVKNGAKDYLLLPKHMINSAGDDCDVSGVSYEAFSLQKDRCNVEKDTCLKNQPLDFWEIDDAKRKSGSKGEYFLENYGTPYKDPIIIHPETKAHFLGLEYIQEHLTVLTIEINADEMSILSVGKYAQISKIVSAASKDTIDIYVSVLNAGLMPSKFTVKAVNCGFGVADSNAESVVIPPQMMEHITVSAKPGNVVLDEEFTCTVEVSSDTFGTVAKRDVAVNPLDRCVCNYHCACVCLLSGKFKCVEISEEDYHAAGFRGSLPVLTAKPPHMHWFVKHPLLFLLALFLLLLLCGFIKGLCGLAKIGNIGNFGMARFLHQPKRIDHYLEPDLRNLDVVYDAEGYPINPDSKKRVKVIGEELLFLFNLLFCFFAPCIGCFSACRRFTKKGLETGDRIDIIGYDDDDDRTRKKKEMQAKKDKEKEDKKKEKEAKEKEKEDKRKEKEDKKKEGKKEKDKKEGFFSKKEKGSAEKSGDDSSNVSDGSKGSPGDESKGSPGDDFKGSAGGNTHNDTYEKSKSIDYLYGEKLPPFVKPKRGSRSADILTGPAAEPLNKELEEWKKGTGKIQAVLKK